MQRYAILFSPLLFCTGSKSGRAYARAIGCRLEIDDDWVSPTVTPTVITEDREAAHMLLRLYDEQPSAAQRGIRDMLSIWTASWESASTNHHDIRR